ncbi:glycosyltransferase family 4 protein [Candidatus Woesearchaeota archaeon]|nr:glycosyltransferase family 4 protein [Candidatus Woesearchaeota archaeon]
MQSDHAMKILFVLENYYPHVGGVETLFKQLCEGLVDHGHTVTVLTHQLKGALKKETIHGVRIIRVPCFGSRYLFTFFALPAVLQLAREAEIIHTTTFNGAFPAWVGAKIRKKKLIITVHEVWIGKWKELTTMPSWKARVHDFLEKKIYQLSYDRYVPVSYATKDQLLRIGIPEEKISVVHNGIDYLHFHARPKIRMQKKKREFLIFAYGRPGISKGFTYLIQAMPMITQKIPHARLYLALSANTAYLKQRREIEEMIKEMHIEHSVSLEKPVPYGDLPSYITAADCCVVPSLAEGFGLTAAEVCAVGTPLVATDIPAITEVVSGKYVLVKSRSAKAIVEGVVKVYRKQYTKKPLKRFTVENNVHGYERIYTTLQTAPVKILK